MRFRADIVNTSAFTRLITSLSPLSKFATIKITPETLHVICVSNGEGVQVWSDGLLEGRGLLARWMGRMMRHIMRFLSLTSPFLSPNSQIKIHSIFDLDTFRLESNCNNEIYLEASTDALARALKSAPGATEVNIKLAKKGGAGPQGSGKGSRPVLTLTIISASRQGRSMTIIQDVAVKVKKQSEVDAIKEPLCPAPDVNILLPPLQSLYTVATRLSKIAPIITVSANWHGEFRLRAESDDANVETEWRGLKHPPEDEDTASQSRGPPEDPEEFHSVSVDAKSLLKFLGSYTIAHTTIACVCADHCAIFYVYIGDGTKNAESLQGGVLTFFVPCVSEDGDD